MASGFDIWGVVAGAIGFLSIFQVIAALINNRLPLKQLQTLEETFRETEALLTSVEEEGLFRDNGDYLFEAKHKMSNICKRMKGLRDDAFTAKTYMDEVKQWWRGVSNEITVCCKELRTLRANISTTSSEARKARTLSLRTETTLGTERDGAGNPISPAIDASPTTHGDEPVFAAEGAIEDVASASPNGIMTRPFTMSVQDRDAPSLDAPLERHIKAEKREAAEEDERASIPQTQLPVADSSESATCTRSDSTDTLPSYCRQSSLPPYPSFPALATTILPRCTIPSADAARATRKLVKAYRRNLMVHNVPWQSPGTQHAWRTAISAAASARAIDRPSNTTRHWKLLEERARSTLRPYVAVVSHEAPLVTSPHVNGAAEACRCSCSIGVQQTDV